MVSPGIFSLCSLLSLICGSANSEHIHPDTLATTKTNPPFSLYVYPKEDFVSSHVRMSGVWHYGHTAVMIEVLKNCGEDATLLDYGANIGNLISLFPVY